MDVLADLYETAYLNDITIVNRKMIDVLALSIMDEDGDCFVALNTYDLKTQGEETTILAHDLGHCMTGAFYNRYSNLNNIRQKEYRANKWAVHKLIPFEELQEAFSNGVIERWELAEYFEVTEDFIDTVIQVYQNEGLLVG